MSRAGEKEHQRQQINYIDVWKVIPSELGRKKLFTHLQLSEKSFFRLIAFNVTMLIAYAR